MSRVDASPALVPGSVAARATVAVAHTQSVQNFNVGDLVAGVVKGRNSHNQLVVSVNRGEVLLTTPLSLPPGTPVALQVRGIGDHFLTVIVLPEDHVLPENPTVAKPDRQSVQHNKAFSEQGATPHSPGHRPSVTTVHSVLSGTLISPATGGVSGGILGPLPDILITSGANVSGHHNPATQTPSTFPAPGSSFVPGHHPRQQNAPPTPDHGRPTGQTLVSQQSTAGSLTSRHATSQTLLNHQAVVNQTDPDRPVFDNNVSRNAPRPPPGPFPGAGRQAPSPAPPSPAPGALPRPLAGGSVQAVSGSATVSPATGSPALVSPVSPSPVSGALPGGPPLPGQGTRPPSQSSGPVSPLPSGGENRFSANQGSGNPGPLTVSQTASQTVSQTASDHARNVRGHAAGTLTPGIQLEFRLVALDNQSVRGSPHALLQDTARVLPAGSTLIAGVVAKENSGPAASQTGVSTRILTSLGTVRVDGVAPLPARAPVVLHLIGAFLPDHRGDVVPSSLGFGDISRGQWPGLAEAVAALTAPGGPQILDRIVPTPSPRLAGLMLLFITALRGGDVKGWLREEGQAALTQKAGKTVLNRLREDFSRFGQLLAETKPDDWRFFIVPIHDGRDDHLMHWRIRHHGKGAGKEAPSPQQTRFIIDLTLSRLGDMQFDGFLKERQFDLVIRTRQPLSQKVQYDIRTLYRHALQTTGLHGEILFQVTEKFIRPMPDDKQPSMTAPHSDLRI